MDRTALIPDLLELFRQHGYEGVSIGEVSKVTGLGKSSLYHHFPGGKEQMAQEVLAFIDGAVRQYFIAPLKTDAAPPEKMAQLVKHVEAFYDEGRKNCIVDGLTLGATSEPFRPLVEQCLDAWLSAMAAVALEAGVPKKLARERAENVVVAIEGALVVSRALNDTQIFKRVAKNLPQILLGDGER